MQGRGMRREAFGAAGDRLDAEGLVAYLTVAGTVPEALQQWLDGRRSDASLLDALGEVRDAGATGWRVLDLSSAAEASPHWSSDRVLADWRQLQPRIWQVARASGMRGALLVGAEPDLDRAWLVALLVQDGPWDAAVFEAFRPEVAALDWPLRVSLPDDADGRVLQAQLADAGLRELFEPMHAAPEGIADLMLLPGPLSGALAAARATWSRASVVLVLGEADLAPEAAAETMEQLAYELRAAVVGVCGWPALDQHARFLGLLAQLSHNLPLPEALFEERPPAQRRAEADALPANTLGAPLLLCDIRFTAGNRPADAAARLAGQLHRWGPRAALEDEGELRAHLDLPPGAVNAEGVARALERQVPRWPWHQETEGATRLARLRRSLEAQLGPLDLRRAPWSDEGFAMAAPPEMAGPPVGEGDFGPLPPPPPPSPSPSPMPDAGDGAAPDAAAPGASAPVATVRRDPRHLKADLLPASGERTDVAPPLQPDGDYRLEVFIAPREAAAHATAGEALDESRLPDRPEGHALGLVYCPLSPVRAPDGRSFVPPPVRAALHLPATGASERVAFALRCGADPAGFRARLIVLHGNRVLQTLLLTAGDDARLQLRPESRYAPGFTSPSADVPADLAFVINDDPVGDPALAAIAPGAVSFLEPAGLKSSVEAMCKALTRAVMEEVGEPEKALARAETLALMRTLANHGAAILKHLARQHDLAALAAARRVQVVEAVDKAYFPVEFLYEGRAPVPDAALCPHALAALAPGGEPVHAACPHRDDKHHVCPAAFWGFTKCIERHAASGDRDHVVSVPVPGEERLGPFTSALLAASERADAQMQGPKGLPSTVARLVPATRHVTSWTDWQAAVARDAPDLLLLVPHKMESPDFLAVPGLEISRQVLASTLLDRDYVHAGAGRGPLVLLMGCSTALDEVAFLDFVHQFHFEGAPVVVGTLSVIHALQAEHLVRRLLETAADPARPAQRLDEAILQVRRELLAAGNGVAFTLVAYGHSAWRL